MTYPIGGSFGFATSPLYPVWQTVSSSDWSYYGADSKWFIFGGEDDGIFPGAASIAEATATFAALGASAPTIEYSVTTEDVGHWVDCRYTAVMMEYVYNDVVSSIDDYEECDYGYGKFVYYFAFFILMMAGIAGMAAMFIV